MDNVVNLIRNIKVSYVIDILIVAYLLYKIFSMIKDTRAEQLIKGIIVLLILTRVSEKFQLYTINWILKSVMDSGILIFFIIFQPELRRGLEYLGRSGINISSLNDLKVKNLEGTINEIVDATASLARQKIGALMVIERNTGLNEIVATGTKIDGKVSSDLLINIFIPNTPLHDGAVIIKDDTIKAAACFLPLTEDTSISKELGTRHRAAVGISEASDSLTIVVSEETGAVSIAEHGNLMRHVDSETLRAILTDMYNRKQDNSGLFAKWGAKHENTKE